MSELQRLQTTDWERRSLAETADAMAHIFPDTERVIRELLSDYDVLRGETATLTAERDELRAENERLKARQDATDVRIVAAKTKVLILRQALDRVRDAWAHGREGLDYRSHTYNPDAHVEVTLTVADVRAILAATAPGEEVRE